MPGDIRWHLVVDEVVARRRSRVPGRIYDTGFDYPGARFDHEGEINGWVLELRVERLDATLARLDEIEGTVQGEYERVVVTTHDGVSCWSYQIGSSVDGMRDLGGVWPVER